MKNFLFIFFFTAIAGGLSAQDISKKELQRNVSAAKIIKEKDAVKKEKIYVDWLKKYPVRDFPHSTVLYGYLQAEISKAYINAGKLDKALTYANKIMPGDRRHENYAGIASAFEDQGGNENAVIFYRKALAETGQQLIDQKDSVKRMVLQIDHTEYSYRLASLLFKEGHVKEAAEFSKYAYEHNMDDDLNYSLLYADISMAEADYMQAFAILEKEILTGKPNTSIKTRLKKAFFNLRDSMEWQGYVSKIEEQVHVKRREDLKKIMIKKPAPAFTLNDLSGNKISLSDYRGKILIVDFWATWCVPCRRSFPFMQKAVDRFEDPSKLHFLFIHTWEQETHAARSAADYIRANKYNFHVLMDLKDPVTEVNNTVYAYEVRALPAKLLIDGNGFIRFKIEPMFGNDEYALEELRIMIELAKEESL